MKRTSRIATIVKILSDHPGKQYQISDFCTMFSAAKSTISEDITLAVKALAEMDAGQIITTPGAGGGIRYFPGISNSQCQKLQELLCQKLSDPERLMGGGFLYVSDIAFDPILINDVARVFARKFHQSKPDFVATIETKGIPLALTTARHLGIPLAVVRRESKISEGPTISINYYSVSAERMQKISLAKKAVKKGSKALIIDDFMRAGGSLRGVAELLAEFEVQVCGIGVGLVTKDPPTKKIQQYVPLLYLDEIDEKNQLIKVSPNMEIFA